MHTLTHIERLRGERGRERERKKTRKALNIIDVGIMMKFFA